MLVMDNQQATSWFSGIVEGEGSFFMKNGTGVRIRVPNTDTSIISSCEKYLRDNGIFFRTYKEKGSIKPLEVINVAGVYVTLLYNIIKDTIECRFDELQRIVGASTTKRSITVDLHWLIGIYEAEGSFGIFRNWKGYVIPRIEISNTNEKIIDKIVKNLFSLDLAWYVSNRQRRHSDKPITQITIQGFKRCKRFLQLTENLWRSSRNLKRSKIMLDFCNYRLALPLKSKYAEIDAIFYNQMKQLND